MLLARQAGFRAIVLSAVWTPPLEAPPAAELAALESAVIAAATNGIRPIVAVYSFSSVTPTTPEARAQFAAYAASIPAPPAGRPRRHRRQRAEPEPVLAAAVRRPTGRTPRRPRTSRCSRSPTTRSRRSRPDINVIGGSLSARGSDDPAGSRPTHSPTRFIEDLGAGYRASGRDTPVMDMFSIHPYPENSSIPPTFEHPQTHRRSAWPTTTSSSRCSAPPSTAPRSRAPRSRSSTASTASRRRSRQQKLGRVHRRRAGDDEADRRAGPGKPVRRRDRDRGLPPDGADAALLPRLGRAAARAAPDRRLLRRRHAEIEPGADRARSPRRPGGAPGVPLTGRRGATHRRSPARGRPSASR